MKVFLSVLLLLGMFTVSSEAEARRCVVDLENGRGRVLETFRGFGYDRFEACRDARRQCRRVIRSGYYRARIQNCVERRVGPGPGRRMVSRSCTARLTGPRGHRTIQTFLGRATGPRGSGVMQQACQRAARQCRVYKRRTGRVRAVCQIDRGRGGYGGYNF